VDTRKKILTIEQARQIPRPVAMAIGCFDVLRASTIRELEGARRDSGTRECRLLAVVVPSDPEVLSAAARAEMAAALRMVDYVVTADPATADRLGEFLGCFPILRLSAADALRARELKDDVRSRQK